MVGGAGGVFDNGQAALNNSVKVSPNSARRVGVDPESGEIVTFQESHHGTGIFHGYATPWSALRGDQRSALIKSGKVSPGGRINN